MTKKKRSKKNDAKPVQKEEKAPPTPFSKKTLNFCLAHKWDAAVFAAAVIVTLIVILPGGILPWPPGSEAEYYTRAATRIAAIWRILPGFLYNFISGTYTIQDYMRMGFVNPSGTDTIFNVPCYATYLSFWILLLGRSLPVLIASQLFVIGLIYVQIFRIVGKYVSHRASLWTTFLSMSYYPLLCGAVLTGAEPFIALCLLLTLRLYIAVCESPSRKNIFWMGLCAAITTGAKSSLMYFIVVFLVLVTSILVIRYRQRLKALYGFFLFGVFLPMMIMFVVYSRTNGKYGFMESGAGGRNLYAGQQYKTNCLYTYGVYQEKWFVEEARKVTNAVDPRMWFVQFSEVSSRAFVKVVLNDFGPFFLHTVRKAGILTFFPPHNTFRYVAGHDYLQNNYPYIVHLLLVIFAFSSIIFVRKAFDAKLFLCATFLYHVALYGMSNIGTRYLLPMTPLYMVFAGILLGSFKTWAPKWKTGSQLASLFATIAIIYFCDLPAFMGDYYYVYAIKVLLLSLLALGFVWIALKPVMKGGKWPDTVVAGLVLTYCLCCFVALLIADKRFLSTTVKAKQEISQTINMDGMFRPNDYQKFYLMFDSSLKTDVEDLKFFLNGVEIKAPIQGRVSPVEFARLGDKVWEENEPQWNFIEVDPDKITYNNTVNIKSDHSFKMNADHPSEKVDYLPSHVYYIINAQIVHGWEKAKLKEKRVFFEKKPLSTSRESQADGEQCAKDLRVYLVGKRNGGWCIPKQYEGLNKAHEFYLSLLRLTDRGLLRYKTELTEDDVLVERPIVQALMGEYDIFYSGYDLF